MLRRRPASDKQLKGLAVLFKNIAPATRFFAKIVIFDLVKVGRRSYSNV